LNAVRRIIARLGGPPIGPRRWKRNKHRLRAALEDLDPTQDDVAAVIQPLAEAGTWEVIHGLMAELEEYSAPEGTVAKYSKRLQTALERILCEDLLGPKWRSDYEQSAVSLHEQGARSSALAMEKLALVDALRMTDAVLESLPLTSAERELWEAFFQTRDWSDAEALLDITPTAFRQRKSRLLKKLAPLKEALKES